MTRTNEAKHFVGSYSYRVVSKVYINAYDYPAALGKIERNYDIISGGTIVASAKTEEEAREKALNIINSGMGSVVDMG